MNEMEKSWIYSVMVVALVVFLNFQIIEKWDSKMKIARSRWWLLFWCCVLCGNCAAQTGRHWLCVSVILGCLMTACVTDMLYYKVHNFLWWISGGAAGCMVLRLWIEKFRDRDFYEGLCGLVLFLLLQFFLFAKMYGRADCYAFSVCAVAEFGLGMHIFEFLLHMIVAYVILFIIQLIRKNIAKSGNLKVSIAFIPYITASFLIFMHKYAIWGLTFV